MDNYSLRKGMIVRSVDGEKVGKLTTAVDNTFLVEKGILFPEDFTFNVSAIDRIEGDVLYLKYTLQQVRDRSFDFTGTSSATTGATYKDDRISSADRMGASAYPEGINPVTSGLATDSGIGTGLSTGLSSNINSNVGSKVDSNIDLNASTRHDIGNLSVDGGTVRVPLREEEVDVHKNLRDVGELRLKKTVVTETKHFEVPVQREEVTVERVHVTDPTEVSTNDVDAFQETVVSVPIHEEQVEVRKHAVVREEVRLTKNVKTEQRGVDATVRREEAHIEKDGSVRRLDEDVRPLDGKTGKAS